MFIIYKWSKTNIAKLHVYFTSYENVKKSCNGRIWWRNTQEILVIPVPLHFADCNLSIVNMMVSFEIFPEPLDQSKPNQMGLWIGCILSNCDALQYLKMYGDMYCNYFSDCSFYFIYFRIDFYAEKLDVYFFNISLGLIFMQKYFDE